MAAWRNQTFPAIRAEAAQVGATIYFLDEAHLRADYHAGTTWAPAGKTPIVQAMGRRDPVTMISARLNSADASISTASPAPSTRRHSSNSASNCWPMTAAPCS